MSEQEKQHVRDVIRFFFPQQSPQMQVTPEMAELAAEMLHEALKASEAMDFVPRPPGMRPGAGWLLSQAVRVAWRRAGKQQIYEAVRRTVALKYRSRLEMAKLGV